jgi:hypothetical protein
VVKRDATLPKDIAGAGLPVTTSLRENVERQQEMNEAGLAVHNPNRDGYGPSFVHF